VSNFIERFIAMGIDVLNPLEPPKNGMSTFRIWLKITAAA